jgi:glutamate racemase
MLGVFDSGFGGLTVLKPIHELLPSISTIYLGDNARAPYGVRTQDEIFRFTLDGVKFLFDKGCPLVVLACNTASSQALRRIQREVLPREYPDRRVLGVIRPAVEYLATRGQRIGIFGTPATVVSGAYIREFINPPPARGGARGGGSPIRISQVACPGLTDLIEKGLHTSSECDGLVKNFCDEMLALDPAIEEVLLACTHYPLVYNLFRQYLPAHINIVTQGNIVADSLKNYLLRHPQIDTLIDKTGTREYLTTNGSDVSTLASLFYGSDLLFEKATI